jgi:hypothetical protein
LLSAFPRAGRLCTAPIEANRRLAEISSKKGDEHLAIKRKTMKKNLSVSIAALALALLGARDIQASPTLSSVSVGPQSPAMVAPGGSAQFAVTVTVAGNGNLDAYLSVTGLPAGATASFSPAMITFTGSTPGSQTAILTITTTASMPLGGYDFTATANDGGSHNNVTCQGTLMVGVGIASLQVQPDSSTKITCCGFPGQTYLLQASASMITPSWTTIATNTVGASAVFTFIDLDAKNYPCRFYRTMPQ